jgi:PAS domain S-box-containing protein
MKDDNKTKAQLVGELSDLRRRVCRLEELDGHPEGIDKALRESEELHRITLSAISDAVFITDNRGALTFICPNVAVIFGYCFDEVRQMGNIAKLLGKGLFSLRRLKAEGEITNIERDITDKSGQIHSLLVNAKSVSIQGGTVLYSCRDITERKKAQVALQKAHDELELRVQERTVSLEEANTAMRVLLHQSENDKEELEEKVLMNVKELVAPYIEKLGSGSLDQNQRICLQVLDANLQNIVSPFSRRLSSQYQKLTPAEIRVASLIRDGKSTKEIAEFLNLSKRTIDSYRKCIRKKLGLQNEKINLMTHLMSIN